MRSWPVQDAKARFSELLQTCQREGPQLVTKRGKNAAVLVPIAEWQRLSRPKYATLKDWLMAEEARTDNLVPPRRRRWRPRAVEFD